MISVTPNHVAYAALLVWPLVSIVLFRTRPFNQALIWTILGGYLLLPVGTEIKFPGVPAFDKNSIPALAGLAACLVVTTRVATQRRGVGFAEVFLVALLLGPFITSEFNSDALTYGDLTLPGVGHYDALSASVAQFIMVLPFLLGRRYLASAQDAQTLVRVVALAGLVYSLPMLIEIRLSPQLHEWIYGYFPHSFGQQMRDGGFRPVVFLGHGLRVAFFTMTAFLASVALWRCREKVVSIPPSGLTAWLGGVLLLCKALGSSIYAVVLGPVMIFMRPRAQVKVAAILVSFSLIYPMLRAADMFPSDYLLEAAGTVSVDRQASLRVRFEQEKMLLNHGAERLWFGWGRFGRGRVYDDRGKDITQSDGRWIVTMVTFGLIGFLAEFGLLAFTVLRTLAAIDLVTSLREKMILAALAIIVAIGLLDSLPNASDNPFSWMIAGVLLGRVDAIRNAAAQPQRRNTQAATVRLRSNKAGASISLP